MPGKTAQSQRDVAHWLCDATRSLGDTADSLVGPVMPPVLIEENVVECAMESVENLLDTAEGRALLSVLKPVERGDRDAESFGERGHGLVAAFEMEELPELSVESPAHTATLPEVSFRMWKIWRPRYAAACRRRRRTGRITTVMPAKRKRRWMA